MNREGIIILGILLGLPFFEVALALNLAQKRYSREISDLKQQLRAYQAHHLPDGERGDAAEQATYYWNRVQAMEYAAKGESK